MQKNPMKFVFHIKMNSLFLRLSVVDLLIILNSATTFESLEECSTVCNMNYPDLNLNLNGIFLHLLSFFFHFVVNNQWEFSSQSSVLTSDISWCFELLSRPAVSLSPARSPAASRPLGRTCATPERSIPPWIRFRSRRATIWPRRRWTLPWTSERTYSQSYTQHTCEGRDSDSSDWQRTDILTHARELSHRILYKWERTDLHIWQIWCRTNSQSYAHLRENRFTKLCTSERGQIYSFSLTYLRGKRFTELFTNDRRAVHLWQREQIHKRRHWENRFTESYTFEREQTYR